MRLLGVVLFFAVAAFPQELPSPDTDGADDQILKSTLYVSISADDIYREPSVRELARLQADQMMAASKRRMERQEQKVEALKSQVEQGKASPEELKAAIQEMNRRIEVSYLALSRATVLQDIIRSAEAEQKSMRRGRGAMERYDGGRPFTASVLRSIELAFRKQFGRALPISAEGDTALHRALGLDHSGRVDVAIHPDQPEGIWLRHYLESMHVPYYGFRSAVPGSATAPHIHIGPGSVRYHASGYRARTVPAGY